MMPGKARPHLEISIHALREEGDEVQQTKYSTIHISIHALREEGDAARAAPNRAAL